MSIKENIAEIINKVQNAKEKAGRTDKIIVIAVSKTQSAEKAREAVEGGMLNLGENKVQELVDKYEKLSDLDIKWHMIGHLQKNKVKYIIDKVELIHSLDSIALAEEINKRAKQNNLIAKVLVELNIGEEESKIGIKAEDINDFLIKMEQFENIQVLGLMTVAPFEENPEDVRWVFRKMKELFDNIKEANYKNAKMEYLSMGMTNDFEVAIEEGSNIVRIGTAIFGERNYNRQ